MKVTPAKLLLTLAVLGILGIVKIVGVLTSLDTIKFHTAMFDLAMGFGLLSLALDPANLFRGFTEMMLVRSSPAHSLVSLLNKIALTCMVLSFIGWIRSHYYV